MSYMFFSGMSPEEAAEQADRESANLTASYLGYFEFIEAMNQEAVDWLIGQIILGMSKPDHLPFMYGTLLAVKRSSLDICSCSPGSPHKVSDHSDPEFLFRFGLDKESDNQQQPASDLPWLDRRVTFKDHREQAVTMTNREAMEKYNLAICMNAEVGDHVHCKRCMMKYVSIGDRMLRRPGIEGCDGCIMLEKNGGRAPWEDES